MVDAPEASTRSRHHGLPDILRQASSTDSYGPLAPLRDGLGFLPGGACPHLLDEENRRASLRRWVATGQMPTTYAADDHVALVWRDGTFVEAIAEAEGHLALRVEQAGDRAVEHEITARLLG